MNDPRTLFSGRYDQNIETPFSQNNSSRLSQNDGTCSSSSDQEFLQFRQIFHHQELMESDDSGICSPPFWKNTPSPQPLISNHHVHRNLSPDSRLQAITKGQRELMEMVKAMPESSYELTLKDLVEHHKIETQNPQPSNRNLHQRAVVKVKRQESKKNEKNLTRIESFEYNGLLLKMVFPFSLKSKKKDSANGKVSPKAEAAKGGGGGRDWWKKKFTGSSDSDSSRISNNSGSSGSSSGSGGSNSGLSDGADGSCRKKKGSLRGCWLFRVEEDPL